MKKQKRNRIVREGVLGKLFNEEYKDKATERLMKKFNSRCEVFMANELYIFHRTISKGLTKISKEVLEDYELEKAGEILE